MSRAGSYVSNLSGEMHYLSFRPSALPPDPPVAYDLDLVNSLVRANRAVASLEVASTKLPDVPLFLSMYVRKEALLSSQIEGTQATLDDILDPKTIENADIHVTEVLNYIRAVTFAENRLRELPVCNRLLAQTHRVLMSDIRGGDKSPGEFRRSQNWIGAPGSTLNKARYVPPNVADMQEAMTALEVYINTRDNTDPLVKAALIHYQFETIHPFLDGNGRIGRLLVYLFLKANGLLTYPTLYISYYLKRNRIEYYDRLTEVREKGDYEQWIRFFLEGICETCADALESIESLSALHKVNLTLINACEGRTLLLKRVFNYLETTPIISTKNLAVELGVSFNTASTAIVKLEQLGILLKVGTDKRNRRYAYEEYLKILRKDT